jgi:signal transduction histidine kinase
MMNQRFVMLGRIAAGVAHDLNNYLAVVDLALTAIQRSGAITATRKQLTDAREAVQSARKLTNGLLDYARGGTPAAQPVDLGLLVRHILELFEHVIPENVTLELETETDAPLVRGVAAELDQLVLNLIVNACDAMPDGGDLSVSVHSSSETGVTLEVADTGCGLAQASRDAEGPTSPSSKRGDEATGLGLGIVRSVAERHGAALEIGRRSGGGTRIVVRFIATRADSSARGQ